VGEEKLPQLPARAELDGELATQPAVVEAVRVAVEAVRVAVEAVRVAVEAVRVVFEAVTFEAKKKGGQQYW
jgi:hypothetical protein